MSVFKASLFKTLVLNQHRSANLIISRKALSTNSIACNVNSSKDSVNQSNIVDSPLNKYSTRSHTCGELRDCNVGERVLLEGWVTYTRFDNKIISLKDSHGSIQCIVDSLLNPKKLSIPNESILRIHGLVRKRPSKQVNSSMGTGQVEIAVDHLEVVNSAYSCVPLLTRDHSQTTEDSRLRYRYLDLKSKEMQEALRFRSKVSNMIRKKLLELEFVECETPTLINRTPGGANEFIVPTKEPDHFFSLAQSPQQLKQLLMIGGLDRYFQMARCYRDESTRPDRQPEFTQVDIELSFTSQELVMQLVEDIVKNLFQNLPEVENFRVGNCDIQSSEKMPRMSYNDAIQNYGVDKPDTRFGCRLKTSNDTLMVTFPFNVNQTLIDEILNNNVAAPSENFKFDILRNKDSTTLLTQNCGVQTRTKMGTLRTLIASKLHETGHAIYKYDYSPVWVQDFPLFKLTSDGLLKSNHHPFTAPTKNTIQLLRDDPLKVIGQHYDLVMNGQEVAGGSIRIHDSLLQKEIFNLLDIPHNKFAYFLEALNSGCPPHGGIAFGLDRLVAILLNKQTIKDVIAFPKSSAGRDVMIGCPEIIDEATKEQYHIKIDL